MTREQEILARAMNQVDDELIAAAHAPRKRLRHFAPALVAACLCVAIVVTFPYLRAMVNIDSDKTGEASPLPGDGANDGNGLSADMGASLNQSKPDETASPTLGDTVQIGKDTVTMTALTENTATLYVIKQSTTPLYVAFRQYAAGYLASTQPDFRDGSTILRPGQIKLYINGASDPADSFPTTVGEYEIVVDFTSLRNSDYRMSETLILYSCAPDGEQVESHWFSIDLAYAEEHRPPAADTESGAAE